MNSESQIQLVWLQFQQDSFTYDFYYEIVFII